MVLFIITPGQINYIYRNGTVERFPSSEGFMALHSAETTLHKVLNNLL